LQRLLLEHAQRAIPVPYREISLSSRGEIPSCRGEGGVGARFIAPWVGLDGRPLALRLLYK
jgi:hypothetical protein